MISPGVYLWSGVSNMAIAMNEFEKAVMNCELLYGILKQYTIRVGLSYCFNLRIRDEVVWNIISMQGRRDCKLALIVFSAHKLRVASNSLSKLVLQVLRGDNMWGR
jgi:hypothetical protein